MVKSASDAMKDVDLVLFLINPDEKPGRGDLFIIEQLKEVKVPVFLVLNKIDENPQEKSSRDFKSIFRTYGV